MFLLKYGYAVNFFVLNGPMVKRSFPSLQILNLFIYCFPFHNILTDISEQIKIDKVFPTLRSLLLFFRNGKTEKLC